MIATISIIGEDGAIERVALQDEGFSVDLDGREVSPAITQNIEREKDTEENTLYDQCGNFERDITASRGVALTIQAIVTDANREGNMSLLDVFEIEERNEIDIVCDLYDGPIKVRNVVTTQAQDVVSYHGPDSTFDEKAYTVQFQLGEDQGENA